MGLDINTIQQLLEQDKKNPTTTTRTPKKSLAHGEAGKYPNCARVGPFYFVDTSHTCASKGCGTATYCMVANVPYCMIHTIYRLNSLIIENEWDFSDCNCNAGKHSMFNIHTEDCAMYTILKGETSDSTPT